MKFKQNYLKSFLKVKSRHNLTYEFTVEVLIALFFLKMSIKKSTDKFRNKKKHFNAQIFENDFNNFATINMFLEI